MKRKVWDYLTNFEVAGLGGLTIALGDLIWLIKESAGLGYPLYFVIAFLLLTGAYISIVSIVRHHQKHKLEHCRRIRAITGRAR